MNTKTTYELAGYIIEHEFDSIGRHQLIVQGNHSLWTGHTSIARLNINNIHFAGTTDYWDTVFPRVFIFVGARPKSEKVDG